MDYKQRMAKARKTNLQRDQEERAVGFAAPSSIPIDGHLRTAVEAIRCGIMTNDWSAVAEGQDMLISIHERMTGERYGD